MKMARFQTFWIQIRKDKPLDESSKTGQTSGTKMAVYSYITVKFKFWETNCFGTIQPNPHLKVPT
ncbi:hypothetical protein Hanom_Chr07g00592921 [Helianthus anomalus]